MKSAATEISHEVKNALENKIPVVGIESANSILYCGNYPENISVATSIEETIRKNGAVPATILILDGKIRIGVSKNELEMLGTKNEVGTVARRDIPFYINSQKSGAATVSATIFIANSVGIQVITSGGIGGVHVGAEKSFDISSDLYELSRNAVSVICSGSKSFIDAKLSMEYLETSGVPVIGYRTSCFPSFLVSKTDIKMKYRIDNIKEVARIIKNTKVAGVKGGVLITNPISEEYAINSEVMREHINKAVKYSMDSDLKFAEITPCIFSKVNELTSGKSVGSNIELLIGNAQVASELSVALSELE